MSSEVDHIPPTAAEAGHPYPKLAALTGYSDPSCGISETFLTPVLGGAGTVAVLSSPLGPARPTSWVLCHSFALEQIYLQPLEVPFIRELSASGSRVVRYHSQGYGDSELPASSVSLASHVADAVDAVELLRELGAKRIGLIGSRFGGSVAALTADRIGADALILWEPVLKGRGYLNGLARRAIVSQLTVRAQETTATPKTSAEDPLEKIRDADEQTIDLQGFPLTHSAYEQILRLDVLKDLSRFSGDTLVVQISRSPERRPDLRRLVARLLELGANPTHDVVSHPRPQLFASPRYRPTGTGEKRDTQAGLLADLTERTIRWCRDRVDDAAEVALND